MKDLDFQDYTARVTDEDGDEHTHTVTAHVVTDETAKVKNEHGNLIAREIMTPTGTRRVAAGDVLVATDRPDVYDHLTADAWASTGYAGNGPEEVDNDESDVDVAEDNL